MILTFRPIKVRPPDWKPAGASRPASPFSATYTETLNLLDRELHAIKARPDTLVLQVETKEGNCRLDGQLRADAVVNHPGVILSFETKAHGVLTYPCDKFESWYRRGPSWQHNLRAIALGLEALRKVERYGIAERGQQYAGYRELGSGIALGPAEMTPEQAARILVDTEDRGGDWTDLLDGAASAEAIKATYANAVKEHHPDKGGDPAVFRTITTARDVLLEASR